MTELPHSEKSSNVSDMGEFLNSHYPELTKSNTDPEIAQVSDSTFAARLLDAWAQLPEAISVHEHVLHDASDDERLATLIEDDEMTHLGAYRLSPEKIQALEIMYRLHFIYQRTERAQTVRHPMIPVLFQRIVEED